MAGDRVEPLVSLVEVRLEDLHFLLRDHRSANASNELLALAAEHHAGDNLDPPTPRAVEHARKATRRRMREGGDVPRPRGLVSNRDRPDPRDRARFVSPDRPGIRVGFDPHGPAPAPYRLVRRRDVREALSH